MKNFAVLAAAAAWCLPLAAQTQINGSRTILGNFDSAAAASSRLVTGNGAPPSAKCNTAKAIASSTNATPIVVTSSAHGFSNGDVVTVYGHATDTAANGTWVAGSVTANTFALCSYWDGSTCQNPAVGNGVGGATGYSSAHVGRLYFRNDAVAGQNIYMCTDSAGSPAWVQMNLLANGGTGAALTASNGGILYSTASAAAILAGTATANKLLLSGASTTPAWSDFPAVMTIPAANCTAGVAGSGWSSAASTFTAACRGGSNNLGGSLQGIPSAGTAIAQFTIELPLDWDTATQPYISILYGSGANTSGTVIWTVSSACSKQDGSVSDDPAFNAETAFASQTMATANRTWGKNGQLTAVTSGNNCVAGSPMTIKLALTGTASSNINAYLAVVTVPRLPTVQAN